MKISVSYLSSYYSKEKTIQLIEKTTADYIHVDLMDGGFVPNRNFTLDEVERLLKNHELALDIHLMTFDPLIYIASLATLKPEYITFHVEATKDVIKTIEVIKSHGIKVGISYKPTTSELEIMPYLPLVDLVLVMGVNPGAGGQAFIEDTKEKITKLKQIREQSNLKFLISVDGGMNELTAPLVKDADILVSGSFICKSTNYNEQIKKLKESIK